MDMSEGFIKMCERAEEIQALQKFSGVYDGYNRLEQGVIFFGNDIFYQEGSKYIWLPRQDQLQEMVGSNSIHKLLEDFIWWATDWEDRKYDYNPCMPTEFNPRGYDSMEQLWLAFVMNKKHNKTWEVEKWILVPRTK